ncbi:cytochrome-c peroxidase [Hydrogenimonas sp.]
MFENIIKYNSILLFSVIFLFSPARGNEPIEPIPRHVEYDTEKAELGKVLFLDAGLSSDGTVSCHSCHDFDHGGADPRPVSIGVHGKEGNVNSPTVFNSYFNFRQFWNGRARNLKEQVNGPIHNPVEMDMLSEDIEKYLRSSDFYIEAFQKIYHRSPRYEDMIDAIVEFEKALFTPDGRFDRYLRGETELTMEETKGYRLFKIFGCITCHNGVNVGGNSFQKFGLIIPFPWKEGVPDRYDVTGDPKDKNVFKVPTLRNIELTAPYFHDGSAKTLREAVKKMAYHNLGFELNEEEMDAIEAFLKTLTGKRPAIIREDD